MAKLVATDTAMSVSERRAGPRRDVPASHMARLERFFRDAKATQLYEGTNQIQRIVIARHVLS